jgi:hypothetical protein
MDDFTLARDGFCVLRGVVDTDTRAELTADLDAAAVGATEGAPAVAGAAAPLDASLS